MDSVHILWIEGRRIHVPDLLPAVERQGYRVHRVPNGREATLWLRERQPQLVVLYAASLGSPGHRIYRQLQQLTHAPHIIILPRQVVFPEEVKNGRVLHLPLRPATLVRWIQRLMPIPNEDCWKYAGPIAYDPKNLRIRSGDRVTVVTRKVMDLLLYFLEHPNEVLPREKIFEDVWGMPSNNDLRTLEVHICWLRRALGDSSHSPRFLHTVWRKGYRFVLPDEAGPEDTPTLNSDA